jgi:outer membrane protein OmpA-like peptidoglycan-associated protein
MRKFYLTLGLLAALTVPSAHAQDYIGLTTSNYAGVNKLSYNPASIADSRFKADVCLYGYNLFVGNDYVGISNKAIFNPDLFNDPNFADKYLPRSINKKTYSAYVGLNVQLPSLMVTITKNDAIALSGRIRSITNLNGLGQELADLVWEGLKLQPNWNQNFIQKRLELQSNTWAEYGLSYGRVILNKNQHFLKGGITLKLLQGLGAAYLFGKDVEYNFKNSDTVSIFNADISYGHSGIFDIQDAKEFNYKFYGRPTVGVDFGFEYEWRPKYMNYQYEMDGKKGLWRRDKNKYKLKAGFAITDLGGIRYEKGGFSGNFNANVTNLPTKVFDNVSSIQTLDSTLNSVFVNTPDKGTFRMGLPTMLSLQVDYNVWKGFYINFSPFISLTSGRRDDSKVRMWNNYALTPRYELKWFGIYLPNSYNTLTGFNSGISLRLGPVVIGSGTVFSSLAKRAFREADIHMLYKIPIPFGKPKDRDNDKVSDKMDKCRNVAGVWEFRGCPDTDSDGLQDSEDECPTEAGPKELNGCPDRDGDGIKDKSDSCPDEPGPADLMGCPDRDGDGIIDNKDECPDAKGPAEFNGCPDTDGDGIIDIKDDCPDVRGLAEFNGCPDADGDGLPDRLDECPTLPGPKEKFGCPDRDGDGITDNKDACPDEPGLAENNGCPFKDSDGDGIRDIDDKCPQKAGPIENGGCPYADTDKDGIIDIEDKCPNTPGVPENFGCPAIAKEEQEVIQEAFDNLEFATGKSIIRTTSYESLDKLAELLKKKKDYNLLIEGHTDNVGKRESNLTLSKNRAEAVKTYLMKKGVPGSRLKTKYYGPDRPIDDNNTEEGRQRNRRVEMTIVFE